MTSGASSSCRSPPWLADIARSNGSWTACSHGTKTPPTAAIASGTPSMNGEDRVQVNTTCTRGSASNTASTSNSRVNAVTLCTTASTWRWAATVRQVGACGPTGTRTQGGSITLVSCGGRESRP